MLDWDNDGSVEPHEVAGTAFIAGAAGNLMDEMDSSGSSGGYGGGGDDEGGVSCGCLVSLFLVPFLLIMLYVLTH